MTLGLDTWIFYTVWGVIALLALVLFVVLPIVCCVRSCSKPKEDSKKDPKKGGKVQPTQVTDIDADPEGNYYIDGAVATEAINLKE